MSKMIFNGLEFVAGQEINNNGVFIDTSKVITSGTFKSSAPLSYIATEDCYFYMTLVSYRGGQIIEILLDGSQVCYQRSMESSVVMGKGFYLKKGQTITGTTECADDSYYTVYGVQSGSISNVQHNYSTSEQLIGTWIDGKPLYEITIDQTINANADYTVIASGVNHAYLVNSKCEYSSGLWVSPTYLSLSALSNAYSCYITVQNGVLNFHNQTNQSVHWIATIQYTKTTD